MTSALNFLSLSFNSIKHLLNIFRDVAWLSSRCLIQLVIFVSSEITNSCSWVHFEGQLAYWGYSREFWDGSNDTKINIIGSKLCIGCPGSWADFIKQKQLCLSSCLIKREDLAQLQPSYVCAYYPLYQQQRDHFEVYSIKAANICYNGNPATVNVCVSGQEKPS